MYLEIVLFISVPHFLEGITVITVSHISVYNELTSHIYVGDILVAINGKCIGVLPPTCSIQQWQSAFMEFNCPRLVSFFHYDPKTKVPLFADQVDYCLCRHV